MKLFAGIDAGSRAIKIVLIEEERKQVVASGLVDQGVEQNALAETLYNGLLKENGWDRDCVVKTVATGYGRNLLRIADETITEITCHAKGVCFLHPEAKTIVEIGGQDSKVIHLDGNGSVRDFSMNDRCAAGTGRFMEVVANRLEIQLDEIERYLQKSQHAAKISSMCVVFAETEIIGLLASGTPAEDILAGVQKSIVSRVAAMAGRQISDPVLFTGGVAMISGMVSALESNLNHPVILVNNPQMTGALGAALLASERA